MRVLDDELEVVIEKKKIKNIYFRIDDNMRILVTCPKYVNNIEINMLLKKNQKELERMYKKAKKNALEKQNVYYLGDEYDFILNSKIMIDDEKFVAYGPSVEAVNDYLEKKSLPFFQSRLLEYQNTYDDLPKFRLRIRKMKTRWGVCNKKSMTVTLNTMLIHKKIYLIDYVICHELAHFKYMDHSKAFWNYVEKHYPLYKEARKELK